MGDQLGDLISYIFGGQPKWIAIGILIVIGLILTLAPVVYVALERAQMLKVAAVLTSTLLINGDPVSEPGWPAPANRRATRIPAGRVRTRFAHWRLPGRAAGRLCQSNWIRDKGFGMGCIYRSWPAL